MAIYQLSFTPGFGKYLLRANQEEMVLGDMKINATEAWEYCPRNALRRLTRILMDEFNLVSCKLKSPQSF